MGILQREPEFLELKENIKKLKPERKEALNIFFREEEKNDNPVKRKNK